MARNGSGTYNAPSNSWNPAVSGASIDSSDWATLLADLETALTGSIAKDGQTTTSAAIPFASGIQTDTISELTSGSGVTADGVLLKDSAVTASGGVTATGGITASTITESGSGSGVTADGVLMKDGRVDTAKGSNISSATTTDIGAATGNYVVVTGTATITGLGTITAGRIRIVQFSGILTLTHNGTSLILPTGDDITTAAGDVAVFVSEGSGNWRCASYMRADGTALSATSFTTSSTDTLSNKTINSDSNTLTLDLSEGTLTGTTAEFNTALSDGSFTTLAGTETLTNKTLTAPTLTNAVLNTAVSGTAFLDEDDLSSDSATKVASQQSIKAYVDAQSGGFTDGTAQTPTASASVDFTSIPSGTIRITVTFDGLDPAGGSGSDDLELRIGDSGGIESSGYIGSGVTDGHRVGNSNSGGVDVYNGVVELRRISSATNRWIISSISYNEDGSGTAILSSSKATNAELDRLQLLWSTGGNFVATGVVNIQYE